MALFRKLLFLTAASLTLAGFGYGAEGHAAKPEIPVKSNSPELQKLIDQFNSQRDTVLADRAALLEQLKNATAEQRKALLDRAENQQKELLESQRALGKRIRDEMRKLRESRTSR